MNMRDEWIAALRTWAANYDCVLELWLFGSRAKGTLRAILSQASHYIPQPELRPHFYNA
jgi:hypothetical protein